ncbi:heavy metal translocating P-type ATPase [Pseudogulbenkiania ferrooxidans]|uniref:heavy metal translocating P-type ATPase n=1 Tax=Pseudogulbenkiania ferrooxidans TaxID=549169 RepID=UPI0004CE5675|nr:heavy metal translocating P-type ATPase [Pseudogulbenkiania ferrooxidans]
MSSRNLPWNVALLAMPAVALLLALIRQAWGGGGDVSPLLLSSALPMLGVLLFDATGALKRRQIGVDVLAVLSIAVAIALHEQATAAVVAAMAATGRLLDTFAAGKAAREMAALLQRAPRLAHRLDGEALSTVAIEEVCSGDVLLVMQGEMVPVDGPLVGEEAALDESPLTGESLPVRLQAGGWLRSGAINAGDSLRMIAARRAEDSTFNGIVKLVGQAASSKAPASRLADRYALGFIPVALALAALAWWASGDPARALAVLVVATPCPLLLAVPVALMSGISNCAGRGVLVKGGHALEALAAADVLFFDKTGTLTGGQAVLSDIRVYGALEAGALLRLAAALDQMSCHVLARAILSAAHERGSGPLPLPEQVEEKPGAGICGVVEGWRVAIGTAQYVLLHAAAEPWLLEEEKRMATEGASAVFVAVDGRLEGVLELSDQLRLETPRALRLLRRAGVRRMVMLTGDRREVAESIGGGIGVDEVHAELSPADKLERVVQASRERQRSVMVGDGVNDAPALAAAGVGVAMGARGSAAAAESADIVLLADRLDKLAEAKMVAAAALRLAAQSAALGMGLSLLAMLLAAAGYLPPLEGALLQELIDVAAIANALRALGVRPLRGQGKTLPEAKLSALRAEHRLLQPLLAKLSDLARSLPSMAAESRCVAMDELDAWLQLELLPHEQADERALYPEVSPLLGGDDPLAALSRSHQEIFRGIHRLARLFAQHRDSPSELGIQDIQQALYGLEAVLRLHFAQEDELFNSLSA